MEVQGDVDGFLLTRPAEQLFVSDIIFAFAPPRDPSEEGGRVDELVHALEAVQRERMGKLTLAELIESEPTAPAEPTLSS